jgi:hypothetical protein
MVYTWAIDGIGGCLWMYDVSTALVICRVGQHVVSMNGAPNRVQCT